MDPITIVIKAGREKPIRQRHPWVFSGAIERTEGRAENGAIATIAGSDGKFLARGYYNRHSQITGRILTWDETEAIDDAFWRRRLERAIALRKNIAGDACRLVYSESDGLPGLVVDRYGPWLVMQALTLGIDRNKKRIAEWLIELSGARGVFERSDVEVRRKEGLEPATGVLAGEAPPDRIEIRESALDGRPLSFEVDVRAGHKTGFYLDQRANRCAVARWCAGLDVLNVFSYTGAFGVHAQAAGAGRVTNIDSSADALAQARRHWKLNGFDANSAEFIEADAFHTLRRFREEGRRFDLIILDPPRLAATAGQVDRAARAYKDLNMVALQILNPGGLLATFSCSGHISADLFQKIVFGAAIDAGRGACIIERFTQGPDHPVALTFPEAEYLKGLLCRTD
ncbi:class I SAM-dependent rRNA methyltransferase [bacterium]|nr:class I SAM-dependent rRNA methyltransferase [bacterium]